MAAASEEGSSGPSLLSSAIPASEQTVWADATPLIEAACRDLPNGELIHGDNFSLFAAMSALEIMDPKMDSGMENSGYQSIEEAIENGAAPMPLSTDSTLDVQCTIDVIDHLLACEATWHKGNSLAQTVFSCIYLLQIERTSSHALLHSYCKTTLATCNAIISAVSDARTHEEEDIFTAAYGLPLKGKDDENCLSILNRVEEVLSRQLRACKAQPSKKILFEDLEPLQANFDLEEGFCKALLCRLRFRKFFYHVLLCLRKLQGKGFSLAKKHIASCLAELASIYKSSEFLRRNAYSTHQADINGSTTASGCHPIGFDPTLNSRLSAPAPPRAIKLLSWLEAIVYFKKLLHDLDIICSLPLDSTLEGALHFAVRFQKAKPDLVARSYLQLSLVQDGKLYGLDNFFNVILSALALPDISKNQELVKEFYQNEVVAQLVQLVVNLIKVLCTNVAWQRRKLGKILQDWSVISIQLELALRKEIGETLHVSVGENQRLKLLKHLLIWEQEKTYWIASRFLILGFELELYSPSEYCMVYWYMYVIFVKQLEKLQSRASMQCNSFQRKGKKKKDHPKEVAGDARVSSDVLLLQCYICLAEGLSAMMAALANEHETFKMPSVFNTEEERFLQHFELLQKARLVDHASYHAFKGSTTHACVSSVLKYNYFREVQRLFTVLKGRFADDQDRLVELRQLELIAQHNHIALSVISQAGPNDPSLNISFELSHHPCFAITVVKRS